MSDTKRWIHVFLHKKNNTSNTEANLLKLREVSDWSWYYELHEGGCVLQMKARIPGAIDNSLVDAVNRGMIEEARDIWLEATKGLARGLGPGPGDRIFDTNVIDGRPLPDRSISPGWEPFLRVLFGDASVGSKSSMFIKEITTSFLRLTLVEDQLPEEYTKSEEVFAIKALGYFAAIARSRRFARTDMGLAAYVPMRARRGDLVVVLYGSKVPFVVREKGDGRYCLVGECYMDGIMRGEGIRFAEYENRDIELTLV
ncbi:uncharacterized protein FFUJ_10103 [Fusarium fujikuroi IMI 58289]|uniref:Heterokaryon incompatibility protein (Het-6OR allele) n=1 Tax=Gibberella fujikuroi (strain CBS 195.34 / IMI 58289 / NRRL A-6831) TaxID=1279085 RepID=S0EEV5_GIBF5|nr:uncharacterized protein FFUJ_10103 [Fusarium fujikuroi IMI 58289]CCT73215.1 uncharacterized protein FFUJ_10103 [Fusarium fujikuroi IMI 58289]SCO16336.1 uncharacterized protein FFM5_11224 [Fusarium fujikuroi]